jgi:hypothetical protein
MKRLTCLWLVLCALFWVGRAQAATVALLRPASDAPDVEEALFRLQGELLAVNVAVAIMDRPPLRDVRDTASAEALEWFERTSRERGIDAFIDVIGESEPVAVDVWICEGSPARLRASRVTLEPNAENAAATLALRTIEVLRSSFLVLDLADKSEPRAATSVPPPAKKPRLPLKRVTPLGLEAGAAVLTTFNGVGPALLPVVRLGWALRPWLALQATGAGLGTQPRVEAAAGSVDVAQQFGLLGLCICAASSPGVSPVFSFSVGALHTSLEGHPSAMNLGHRQESWALVFDASVGVRLPWSDRFYSTLATHAQLAEPYAAIHVVDAVVAKTGRPNLMLALTLGARP